MKNQPGGMFRFIMRLAGAALAVGSVVCLTIAYWDRFAPYYDRLRLKLFPFSRDRV